MALHLGNSKKLKIYLNGVAYCLDVVLKTPVDRGIRLLSSEGYLLKDSSGLYLTIKESE